MNALFEITATSRFWCAAKDGDAQVREIFHRHYSRRVYADGRAPKLFMGPGGKIVLITPCERAIFGWRKFIDACIDHRTGKPQAGVNCCIFRNESDYLSSSLIIDAHQWAWGRWPGERLYTYVDPQKVKSSNPGCCFLKAGWSRVLDCFGKPALTKSGKQILELLTEFLKEEA